MFRPSCLHLSFPLGGGLAVIVPSDGAAAMVLRSLADLLADEVNNGCDSLHSARDETDALVGAGIEVVVLGHLDARAYVFLNFCNGLAALPNYGA